MMRIAKRWALTGLAIVLVPLLSGCEKHTKLEKYVLAQAKNMVQRHDSSREKTHIEIASLYKDRKSICGYATIGDRKHIPYIIKYSSALPNGVFATVDLVMTKPPYKGAPPESQADQAARILAACRAIGHKLPQL